MIVSESPGDGEPRRSTKKYMQFRGKEQRREKIKIPVGSPPSVGTAAPGWGVVEWEVAQGGGMEAWGDRMTAAACVTCQWGIHDSGAVRAVTKGCGRTERGEFLGERAGVAEGAWWSEFRESCDWAR